MGSIPTTGLRLTSLKGEAPSWYEGDARFDSGVRLVRLIGANGGTAVSYSAEGGFDSHIRLFLTERLLYLECMLYSSMYCEKCEHEYYAHSDSSIVCGTCGDTLLEYNRKIYIGGTPIQ